MLRVVSPTGCVHAVDDTVKRGIHHRVKLYSTLCNHAGYRFEYLHRWVETTADVNCKRCLHVMNKKIEYKENDWTRSRRGCEHRYPHLKYGVLCRNECYLGAKAKTRLECRKLYCALPSTEPTAATMVDAHVTETIIQIASDLMHTEKTYHLRFNMIAVHCKYKKPAIQDNGFPHMCSNPDLKEGHMDHKFGWACRMNHCPHMRKAIWWRDQKGR